MDDKILIHLLDMDTTTLPQELMLQSSANTPPRVMNRKVKESIDENTNMVST